MVDIKDIIRDIRARHGLSQEEMAKKLFVTRQAVSRWENGLTVPNTDTLKIISRVFGISINTLVGQPRNMTCQVCGSPLEDEGTLSRNANGTVNDQYCKWCYINGVHKYSDMEQVIRDVIPRWHWGSPEQMAEGLRKQLRTLAYWQGKTSE